MPDHQKEKLKELTKRYRRQVQCLLIAAVFFLMSVGCGIAEVGLRNRAYKRCISISESSPEPERKRVYQKAIRLKPGTPDAYLLLLSTYNADGLFSKQESEEFLSLYNKHVGKLPKGEAGAVLHATIGLLYINGYDGSPSVQLRMAKPFLAIANGGLKPESEYYLPVKCYNQMADFYNTYIWDTAAAVREVDGESVKSLLSEIEKTLQAFQSSKTPEAVYNRLGFDAAVCDLLLSQRELLVKHIDFATVERILNTIYEQLPDIEDIEKDRSKSILTSLQENEPIYRSMIDRAYKRRGSQ